MPVLVALFLLAATPALGATAKDSKRTTFLLSRAVDGGFANGPSRQPVVSHDQRDARYMAFESDATNLADGAWVPGAITNATAGANGRSHSPSLDGDSHHRPR